MVFMASFRSIAMNTITMRSHINLVEVFSVKHTVQASGIFDSRDNKEYESIGEDQMGEFVLTEKLSILGVLVHDYQLQSGQSKDR